MLTEVGTFVSVGSGSSPLPPTSSKNINDGLGLLYTRPLVAIAPGVSIALTAVALNLIGDGVRDTPRSPGQGCGGPCDGPPFMLRRIGRRWFSSWLSISVLVFLIFFATPGADPSARIAGRNAGQETLAQVRESFGLDRPLPVQYGLMMRHMFIDRDLDLVRQSRSPGASRGESRHSGDLLPGDRCGR